VGQNGAYTITVSNLGTGPTTGAITVTDTLPAGLGFVSGSGAGWSFASSGNIVTATHAAPLADGDSLVCGITVSVAAAAVPGVTTTAAAPIATGDSSVCTVTVSVAAAAVPAVTNSASVSTAGDLNATNNGAIDPTTVLGWPDLALAKRHAGTFTVGQNGAYTLS